MLQLVSKSTDVQSLISLDELKAHPSFRIEHNDDDATLLDHLRSGTEAAEIRCGRNFLDATYREVLDTFPGWDCPIRLMQIPVKSVSSITYYDLDGVQQTLDSAAYTVLIPRKTPASIHCAPDYTWPSTQTRPDAVTITYVTGFTTGTLPAAFKDYAITYASTLYNNLDDKQQTACLERLANLLSVRVI